MSTGSVTDGHGFDLSDAGCTRALSFVAVSICAALTATIASHFPAHPFTAESRAACYAVLQPNHRLFRIQIHQYHQLIIKKLIALPQTAVSNPIISKEPYGKRWACSIWGIGSIKGFFEADQCPLYPQKRT